LEWEKCHKGSGKKSYSEEKINSNFKYFIFVILSVSPARRRRARLRRARVEACLPVGRPACREAGIPCNANPAVILNEVKNPTHIKDSCLLVGMGSFELRLPTGRQALRMTK